MKILVFSNFIQFELVGPQVIAKSNKIYPLFIINN